MSDHTDRQALVLGGSMAGLLAARVLAERFAGVTIVDRDVAPTSPRNRRGVAHGKHAHALLARGQQIIEELFPGVTESLRRDGAAVGDVLGDTRMHLNGHRLRSVDAGLVAVSASRALLEHHVRRRVAALDGVSFAPPSDVTGLTTDRSGTRVTGARLLRRADGSAEEVAQADLVVDALGRASRVPAWLEELGFPRPAEDQIRVDLRYATRQYRASPHDLDGLLACIHAPTPERPRGCVLARIEDGRWMLTLAGLVGERPPHDPAGYTAFARSIGATDIDRVVEGAEPLDDPVPYRFPASVRRRYERLAPAADGLVPLGDSLCSLDPVYGQGMTVAALQALALRAHLDREGPVRTRRLWVDLARAADAAWDMVRAADLAFAGSEGDRRWLDRLGAPYIRRLHAVSSHDAELACAFVRVAGMVDPPGKLFSPRVVRRVLAPSRRHPGTGRARPPSSRRHRDVGDSLVAALLAPAAVLLGGGIAALWLLPAGDDRSRSPATAKGDASP